LNEKFVCFAPGWFINTKDEVYQDSWKRFYVAKPRSEEESGWLRGTNLVLMTSAGRLLSGSVKNKDGLAQGLQEVLDAYAKLPEVQRRAKSVEGEVKPQSLPPAGGLVLTIYDRPLGRARDGQYRLPEGNDFAGLRTDAPHGQRSSLWLTEEECKSLIPVNPEKGQILEVPTKLTKRIWLYGLVPQTLWVVEGTWSADSVREGKLQLTVEEVTPQTLRLRVHGAVVLVGKSGHPGLEKVEKRYDARLEGVLVYDRAQARIVRWNMAALGDYTGEWFAGHKRWQEAKSEAPLPLAFAFELDQTAYTLPPERRRPRSFIHAYIFKDREEQYWDPDKWLEDWKKRSGK
jgi:hypothetical protein